MGEAKLIGGSEADRAEILQLHERYIDVNTRFDWQNLEPIFSGAPDATYFNLNGHTYNGREHWTRLWKFYGQNVSSTYWTPFDIGGVVTGDLAVVWCHRNTRRQWTGKESPHDLRQRRGLPRAGGGLCRRWRHRIGSDLLRPDRRRRHGLHRPRFRAIEPGGLAGNEAGAQNGARHVPPARKLLRAGRDTAMIETSGIDHIVLHVTDVARAKKFYTEVLGMTPYRENDRQIFLHAGHQGVALFKKQGDDALATGNDMNHLALNVAAGTYETLKAELEKHGVTVTGRPGEDRCIYFKDPDGHRLQLMIRS